MKLLIDTCVIIDALQKREPFYINAEKIFLEIAQNKYEGFITAKSITDIYYLTRRNVHSDKETRKIISKLLTLFNIVDTTELDIKKALISDVPDYEDAVMIETAKRTKMNAIITRNLKDYTVSSIPVCLPEDIDKL